MFMWVRLTPRVVMALLLLLNTTLKVKQDERKRCKQLIRTLDVKKKTDQENRMKE